MSAALVANVLYQNGAGGGTTPSRDTTGATLIVICIGKYNNGYTSPPTDNKSNTYTPLTLRGSGNYLTRIYYCANPNVGTGHTWSYPASGDYPTLSVTAWSGVATSSPLDGENGAASEVTGNVTPSQTHDLAVTAYCNDGSSPSAGGSFTTLHTQDYSGSTVGFGMGYIADYNSVSALSCTWSANGVANDSSAIAIFKSGVAATPIEKEATDDLFNAKFEIP